MHYLYRLTQKKTSKLRTTGPFWRKSTGPVYDGLQSQKNRSAECVRMTYTNFDNFSCNRNYFPRNYHFLYNYSQCNLSYWPNVLIKNRYDAIKHNRVKLRPESQKSQKYLFTEKPPHDIMCEKIIYVSVRVQMGILELNKMAAIL